MEHLQGVARRVVEGEHLLDAAVVGLALGQQLLVGHAGGVEGLPDALEFSAVADLPARRDDPVGVAGVTTMRAARSSIRRYSASGSGPSLGETDELEREDGASGRCRRSGS